MDAVACNGCGQPHDALNGVAPTARNSHQINQHPPRPGGAAHENRERRLAKECVGSNRALKRTIATSRSDDDRDELQNCITKLRSLNSPTNLESRRRRKALQVRAHPHGNRFGLTNSFRNGPTRRGAEVFWRPRRRDRSRLRTAEHAPEVASSNPTYSTSIPWGRTCSTPGETDGAQAKCLGFSVITPVLATIYECGTNHARCLTGGVPCAGPLTGCRRPGAKRPKASNASRLSCTLD